LSNNYTIDSSTIICRKIKGAVELHSKIYVEKFQQNCTVDVVLWIFTYAKEVMISSALVS